MDVISPCVTFFNNEGSTRSYPYMKDHDRELHTIDYIPHFEPIEQVEVDDGEVRDITLHDGSMVRLRGVGLDYDPRDRRGALNALRDAEEKREHLREQSNLVDTPLSHLPADVLRPSREALNEVLAGYA